MLVLSRKLREQVLIPGSNIRITVLSIGKNRVQLGFEAPPDVHITRPEIVIDLADLDAPQTLPAAAGQAIREVTFRAEPITSGGPA
ncbi:MAG: carbon storage regulator [Fuerstiella sp.]